MNAPNQASCCRSAVRAIGTLAFAIAFVALNNCGSPETPTDTPAARDAAAPRVDAGTMGADPDAASPPEEVVVPVATQEELVRGFAPVLNLHPEDTTRPVNVDWYLQRVRMRFDHSGCPDHQLLDLGQVNQNNLITQTHMANKSICTHDSSKVVSSTNSEGFFLEIMDKATYNGAPPSEWRSYVTWIRDPKTDLVAITYWAFYAFNDNVSIIDHESDWENVRITIDPSKGLSRDALREIRFSQHNSGQVFIPGDPNLEMDGLHPVSYVAKGTHANYPRPGTFDIVGTAGVAKDTTAKATGTAVWRTENNTVIIGTRAAPQNGQVFVKYWGLWGEIRDLPETNGIARHFE
jgi:hypothetical protein